MSVLKEKENRLAELPSELEEIADTLTDEEKDSEYYAEDTFVIKEVTKKIKELKNDCSEEAMNLKVKLQKVDSLASEEKTLKSQIKKEKAELEALTKTTIENLTDEDVFKLLQIKWIDGLIKNLYQLPDTIVDTLVSRIEALKAKYATTYFEIEQQIKETEAALCELIDDLEGNEFDLKGLREFKALLGGK